MSININETKLKQLYQDTVDFMLTSDMISNDSILYYPPQRVACPNVINNNNHFGCLECGSNGYKDVEVTETIRLRIYNGNDSFTRNFYKKNAVNIELVSGDVLTLGYLSDAPKISACNYVIFYSNSAYKNYKYRLLSEPAPYAFCRDRYCYAYWRREDLT